MFRKEIKKIVCNPIYWICILIMFGFMFMGSLGFWKAGADENGRAIVSMLDLFYTTWASLGHAEKIVPLVAAIPVTYMFYDEYKSGLFNLTITRVSKTKYILCKIVVAMLSGFMLIGIAEIIWTITMIVLTGATPTFTDASNFFLGRHNDYSEVFNEGQWAEILIAHGKGVIVFIAYNFVNACYAMTCPLIGLFVAVFSKNKYLPLIVPFFVNLIIDNVEQLIRVHTAIELPFAFNNQTMMLQDMNDHGRIGGGIPYVLIMDIIMCTVMGILFAVAIRRGFKRG